MKKLKKLGMLLLAGMLTMTMAAGISAQTPVEGTKLAKAVYGAPEAIDGKLDAGWDNANTYQNECGLGDVIFDEIDVEWKVMYDDTYLYFYIDVTDATIGDEEWEFIGDGSAWAKNAVHVMLDLGYDRSTETDDNYFRFDVGSRGGYYCHQENAKDYTQYAVVTTDKGYTIETRSDFSYYEGFVAEEGTCFGLDIWANDNMPPVYGRVFSQIWSDDQSDSAWKDETKLGTVQLEARPAAVEPEVVEPEVVEPEVVEPEVVEPEVVEPEVVEPEVVEPVVTAPQTFDLSILLLAFTGVSGVITAMVSKKRH